MPGKGLAEAGVRLYSWGPTGSSGSRSPSDHFERERPRAGGMAGRAFSVVRVQAPAVGVEVPPVRGKTVDLDRSRLSGGAVRRRGGCVGSAGQTDAQWRRARDQGVLLTVRRVDVGMSGLRLRHVRVALVGVPGLTAEPEQMSVGLRVWGLTWSRLDARGGRVDVDGSPSELAEGLRKWRSRFGEAGGAGRVKSSGAARPVTVSKVSGRWQLGDGEQLHVRWARVRAARDRLGPSRGGPAHLGRPGFSVDAAEWRWGFSE